MRAAELLLDGVDTEAVAPHVVGRPQRVLDVQRVEPEAGGAWLGVGARARARVRMRVRARVRAGVRAG